MANKEVTSVIDTYTSPKRRGLARFFVKSFTVGFYLGKSGEQFPTGIVMSKKVPITEFPLKLRSIAVLEKSRFEREPRLVKIKHFPK